MALRVSFLTALLFVLSANQAHGLPTNSTSNSTAAVDHQGAQFCSPTNWYSVLIFFLGNYFTHAATVISYPGERSLSISIATIGALLIPSSGLIRGINSITRSAKFKRKGFLKALWSDPDYETAAAAGACVMVVRKKSWVPCKGDVLLDVLIRDEVREVEYSAKERKRRARKKKWKVPHFFETIPVPPEEEFGESEKTTRNVKIFRAPWSLERGRFWMYTDTSHEYVHPGKAIHGFYDFKDHERSYALAHVPRDAIIQVKEEASTLRPRCLELITPESSYSGRSTRSVKCSASTHCQSLQKPFKSPLMGASYSIPKAVMAIFQVVYALVTLYQSSGNQIDTYGYSTFGLTVIPYAFMSMVNLVGSIVTPEYHALYLVSSDVMDEAIRRGARFDGVVGRLVPETDTTYGSAKVISADVHVKNENDGNCGEEEKKIDSTTFCYSDTNGSKTFSVRIEDYTSPSSLTIRERRALIKKRITAISEDLSPSIFVPACPRFLRHKRYPNVIDLYRTQTTTQGSFSFTTTAYPTLPRTLVCFGNTMVILGIIGGMTRFQAGWAATGVQQYWILHWYTFSAIYAGFTIEDPRFERAVPEPDWGVNVWRDNGRLLGFTCLVFGVQAIGGFVVVAQMLLQYGNCAPQN